jgi:hypothetical protein
MGTVPTGLRQALVGLPTPRYHPKKQKPFLGDPVKRGANNHCAYGVGDEPLPAWSDFIQAPLRDRQP